MPQQFVSHRDGYIKWLRERVGSQLIYLVYTTAIVFDEQERLLIQRRADFPWPGIPGGALELGESLADCAVREVREETGVEARLERLVGVFSHPQYTLHYPNGDLVQQWTACFVARAENNTLRADGSETLDACWLPLDEALPQLPPAYQDMLRAAQESPDDAVLEPVYAAEPLTPYWPLLRQHVGHAPILLPGAMALVRDAAGRVLVTRRTDDGLWHPPGGFADLGETTTHTIVREVREETGLDVRPRRVVGVYSGGAMMTVRMDNGDVVQGVGIAFECEVVGGTLRADGDEASAVAFLPPDAITAQPLPPTSDTRAMLHDLARPATWPVIR